MTAITISQQMGSLGRDVARAVAKRLGYRMVWRDIINQAALQAGSPEVALATIDELGLLGLHPSAAQRRAYHDAVRRVIEALAHEGSVVIVGRAGQVILGRRPDVLHVRITAPPGLRAERVAHAQRIGLAAAQAQVQASDRCRRDYLRRYYQARWDDPDLYDITISTERFDPGQAAGLIVQALGVVAPPTDAAAPTKEPS